MAGTFGGALEARQISAAAGRLVAEAVGEIETEEGVLVIRRIHTRLILKATEEQRATAERVHGMFADRCPVYRSLRAAISMTTELVYEVEA
ncbi:MAG: OsmC family protein [Bryobacteraceae bacterium]